MPIWQSDKLIFAFLIITELIAFMLSAVFLVLISTSSIVTSSAKIAELLLICASTLSFDVSAPEPLTVSLPLEPMAELSEIILISALPSTKTVEPSGSVMAAYDDSV